MRFDTKIGIVVRSDLATWQRLNVTAFLAAGVAGAFPETLGSPYADGSDVEYLALFRQPVLVYAATYEELSAVRAKAIARRLGVGLYTDDMFKTGNDADNRAVVRGVGSEDLRLAGLSLYGPKTAMDKTLKGLPLHP